MPFRRVLAVLAFAGVAALPRTATCECIASGPPCHAAAQGDAVFAGTVLSVTERAATTMEGVAYTEQIVRFHLERAFVNSTPGPIELTQAALSSNTYQFAVGVRYVVYAWKDADGRLSTSNCSRTRPLAQAREDLEYFATLPQRTAGVLVSGRVTEWGRHPAEEHGADYGPLKDVVVSATGATYSRSVTTDQRGRYAFPEVPRGKLTVTVVAPAGLGPDVRREFDVKSFGCLPADFALSATATVTGTVQDQNGRPINGLAIDAVAEELAAFRPHAYERPVRTDEYGTFVFDRLPPGRYVLGVNLTSPQVRPATGTPLFFPGTTSAQDATVFELTPGDRKDLGIVRLPR